MKRPICQSGRPLPEDIASACGSGENKIIMMQVEPTDGQKHVLWWRPVARGVAWFFGFFTWLNLLGKFRHEGFDANLWWLDVRLLGQGAGTLLLGGGALLLLGWGWLPMMRTWRRWLTLGLTGLLLLLALTNAVVFWRLLFRGRIAAGVPVPLSLLLGCCLAFVLAAMCRREKSGTTWREAALVGLTIVLAGVVFPLAQMVCFGKTDYRRPADAAIIFGARAYANGQPSQPLADRVRTGCELYHRGYVRQLIFSGGPGDGALDEPEVMRQMARQLGVPETAMILDHKGINTEATVQNVAVLLGAGQPPRLLAVSHFYHLPRVKMAFARAGLEVWTVPARETRTLRQIPFLIGREVAALWVYYLRPLWTAG